MGLGESLPSSAQRRGAGRCGPPKGRNPGAEDAAGPKRPGDQRARELAGETIPDLVLDSSMGEPVELVAWVGWKVLYLVPGVPASAAGDATEHLAFVGLREVFASRVVQVLGVSVQSRSELLGLTVKLGIEHPLLADPTLALARSLDLPTLREGDRECYARMVLILDGLLIRHAFYPIDEPGRAPDQALAWLRLNGGGGHGGYLGA